jgi:hypothetical protein
LAPYNFVIDSVVQKQTNLTSLTWDKSVRGSVNLTQDCYVSSGKSDGRFIETFLQSSVLHVLVGGKMEDYLSSCFYITKTESWGDAGRQLHLNYSYELTGFQTLSF